MIQKLALGVFLSGVLASPVLAQADAPADDGVAGHFQVRLRGAAVVPDSSVGITVGGASIGGTSKVGDSVIPEADLTYFITDHIGVEAIAGVTKHSISNSVVGQVASVELLPPTVTLQYHLDPTGWIRPYVGAGVNYTFFYDSSSPLGHVGFKNSFGWALQGGADMPIGDGPYFLNVDVKKLFLNTSASAGGGSIRATASLDPWIVGTGVGIRF